MNAWLVVIAAGLGSFVMRMSMIGMADKIRLPSRVDDSVALVAPSAFATLAVTGIAGTVLDAGMPQRSHRSPPWRWPCSRYCAPVPLTPPSRPGCPRSGS